jgi:hypothetical protein
MKLGSPTMSSAACRFSPPPPHFGRPALKQRVPSRAPAITTVFNPSGELIITEIVDVVKVSERKVVEFHHFVDTAAIERLVARAHAAK